MSTKEQNNAPAVQDKGTVTYQVAGQDVKLSYQIVRDFLTKGNGQVSDQDLVQFISICKYNQLNPFLNEAYLVKFGTTPAQMIVSKEALMKRAEANDQYDGLKGGLIIQRENQILEIEGNFHLKTDTLLGAWAEVYRKDRKFPVVAKVALDEYDKKQSSWNEKKSTMIGKVAKVQALREAFPAQLGAMYTQEEQSNTIDAEYTEVKVAHEIQNEANKTAFEVPAEVSEETQKEKIPTASAEIAFPKEESKVSNKPSF